MVNVAGLMRLETPSEHPHGMSDAEFGALFTKDKPVILAYHGYPWLICRLTYRRHGHDNLHVRGYQEQGTSTTPVRHGHAARPGPVPPGHGRDRPGARARLVGRPRRQLMVDKRINCRAYTREHGDDARDHELEVLATAVRPQPPVWRGAMTPETAALGNRTSAGMD